jgi:lipoate---protein ligase
MTARRNLFDSYSDDDEMIAWTNRDRMPRVRVYRPRERLVVLGRGSDAVVELDLAACTLEGIPVRKRRGGGCSVVLDPGNVIVSVALPLTGFGDNDRHFSRLTTWLISGIEKAAGAAFSSSSGLKPLSGLAWAGISDIVLGNRKIGGSCIHRTKDLLFYSSTILVDPDVSAYDRFLKHPPREPDYRKGRGHGEFVGGLAPGAAEGDIDRFTRALRRILLPAEAMESVTIGKNR